MLDYTKWTRPAETEPPEVRERTAALIAEIERDGYTAIERFSQKFDGYVPTNIELKPWETYDLDDDLKHHLPIAAARIETFASMQFSMYEDLEREDEFGRFGQRVIPLESMAAYIPGGRFPLVSTAMMTLIPARVAGVKERVAVSPSDHPAVLAAASLSGATRFIRMGGAQAIAAVSLGCGFQEKVDMVVGPGNAYVNAAKALLQDRVKIDTLAGPSEILVLCDESIDPKWVALDVLAQAEHDPMALSVLGSTSRELLEAVSQEIDLYSRQYPDKDTGVIQLVYCPDGDAMATLANKMAPEHLHLACKPDVLDPKRLDHYGSLFVGAHSAVALGDYCTGPNHTLPTLANARQKGGLQVGDFLKIVTWQEVKPDSYNQLADTGISLATVEDLEYHRLSLEVRRS